METATPTQRQIMLSFAYMAYCGELITTPSPESIILGYINSAMPQIPPIAAPNDTWGVVWGPAVYTVPGALYQDNMMYVVQNQADKTQFAIVVRGINFLSTGSGSNASSPLFETYGSNLDFDNLGMGSSLAWIYIVQNLFPSVAAAIDTRKYEQIVSSATQLTGIFNGAYRSADDSLETYIKAFVEQAVF